MLSLPMGGNLLKNQKGVRINLESVQKSCRKNTHLQRTLQRTFEKPLEIKGYRPYTETQKSHRQGGAIVPPCLF